MTCETPRHHYADGASHCDCGSFARPLRPEDASGDVIILRQTADGYTATFQGPHRERILDTWGTDTLPTAFTAQADQVQVEDAIRRRNPGVSIYWGGRR